MSKVTPSALRGLSVVAGTVGLAAVGAAALAGQASAAESATAALAGGGVPVSADAVPAVFGALAQSNGTVADIPVSGSPEIDRLPGMTDDDSPAFDTMPGMGDADLGEPPATRGRAVPGADGVRNAYFGRHAAPASGVPATAAPAAHFGAAAPAGSQFRSAFRPDPTAAPIPNAETGPMDTVNSAMHNLPIADQLTGSLGGLSAVGGLTGGLPLGGLTGGLPLGGLAGGLPVLGG